MWNVIDDLLTHAVAEGMFPGSAIAIGQGNRVLHTCVQGHRSKEGIHAVQSDTLYDIGTLTRIMATVPLFLTALEKGLICLDDPISRYFDNVGADKQDITLSHLLTHTSGMTPHFLLPQEARHVKDALPALLKHALAGSVGGKVRDSAIGYTLLGFVLESVYGMPLDDAFKRFVAKPLEMKSTRFLPTVDNIAPMGGNGDIEESERGYPCDVNARFLRGVAGNAGLFTNLADGVTFAQMLACNGRTKDGMFLSPRAIHLATTERTRGMNEARGMGFRITKRSKPFLGQLWPSGSYGLRDQMSGSLIAVSPEDQLFVVLLSNGKNTPRGRSERDRLHKMLLNASYATFQHQEG